MTRSVAFLGRITGAACVFLWLVGYAGAQVTSLSPVWVPGTQIPLAYLSHHHSDGGGLVGDWVPDTEATATLRVEGSGLWSEIFSTTPLTGDDVVLIPTDVVVTYDAVSDQPLRGIIIQGTLRFSPTLNTALKVGTLHLRSGGTLDIGPDAGVTAAVTFSGTVNTVEDPGQFLLGLLVTGGTVLIEGQPHQTPFTRIVEAHAGSDVITVEEADGWRIGDEVYLADTQRVANVGVWNFTYQSQTERAIIASVSGNQITLDPPLVFDHDGFVANVRRNVIFASDPDGDPGHLLFGGHTSATVKHAAVRFLGRTTVDPVDDTEYDDQGNVTHVGTNQRARYALHCHHAHTKFLFEGNAIVNDPAHRSRFGIVNHDSHGDILGNTVIGASGSGIFGEDGVETGRVENNLVVGMGGGSGSSDEDRFGSSQGKDMGHGGFGYWFRGPLLEVRDNIAVGHFSSAAYDYFTHPSFVSGNVPSLEGVPNDIAGTHIDISRTPIQAYGAFENNRASGLFPQALSVSYSSPPEGNRLRNFSVTFTSTNATGLLLIHGGRQILEYPNFIGTGGIGVKSRSGNEAAVDIIGGRIVHFGVGYEVPPEGGTLSGTYLDNTTNIALLPQGGTRTVEVVDVVFGDQTSILFDTTLNPDETFTVLNYNNTGLDYHFHDSQNGQSLPGVFGVLAVPFVANHVPQGRPTVTLTHPTDGQTLQNSTLSLTYALTGNTDHVRFQVNRDNEIEDMDAAGSFTISDIQHGYHTLRAYPVDADGAPIGHDTVITFGNQIGSEPLPVPFSILPGDNLLYDGEPNSMPLKSPDYWYRGSETEGYGGGTALIGNPTRWHSPRLYLGRISFEGYYALEFQFRNTETDGPQSWSVQLKAWWQNNSETLQIADYIDGTVIDTQWRLVSIPISNFHDGNWNPNNVQNIEFSTNALGQHFELDNAILRKHTPITSLSPVWVPGAQVPLAYLSHHHSDGGGLVGDWIPDTEATATLRVEGSGLWSEIFSTTPLTGDDVVLIPTDVVVTYDAVSDQPLRGIIIQGTLRFSPTLNTALKVGTLHLRSGGTLDIGPDAGVTAAVTFSGTVNTVEDPGQFLLGLLVTGGTVLIEGQPHQTPFTRIVEAHAGSDVITVEEADGWRIGDEVYLADTQRVANVGVWNFTYQSQTERAIIASVSGNQITLDPPLVFDHDGFVANVRRNVIFASDPDGDPGHLLFGGHTSATVKHAAVRFLGRTTVDPVDDTEYDDQGNVTHVGTNQRARYALHCHHAHTKFLFEGNAIVNDPAHRSRFGIVNHDSHGDILGNTVIGASGSGIFGEDGVETGRVENNLVVGMGGGSGSSDEDRFGSSQGKDMGHGGFGYWFRGPLLEVRDNIAVGHFSSAAYDYFTHPSFVSGNVPSLEGVPNDIAGTHIDISRTPIQAYGAFENNRASGLFPQALSVSYSSPPEGNRLRNFSVTFTSTNATGLLLIHGGRQILEYPNFIGTGGIGVKSRSGNEAAVDIIGGRIVHFGVGYEVPPEGGTLSGTYLDNTTNIALLPQGGTRTVEVVDVVFGDQTSILFDTTLNPDETFTVLNYNNTGLDYHFHDSQNGQSLPGVFGVLAVPFVANHVPQGRPTVTLTHPTDGQTLQNSTLSLTYALTGNTDHVRFQVNRDNEIEDMDAAGSFTISDIQHGYHTLRAYPVDADGAPIGHDTVITFGNQIGSEPLPVPFSILPGDNLLYDGEPNSMPLKSPDYWYRGSETEGYGGGTALIGNPTRWHSPRLYLGRISFEGYYALEFQFRNTETDGPQSWSVQLKAWWQNNSETLQIADYIDGTVIDTQWRLVSIPISNFHDGNWNPNNVQNIEFSTNALGQHFELDNAILRKHQILTKPVVGDLNSDGRVDQLDAIAFSVAFTGNTVGRADLNDDGILNFVDLIVMSRLLEVNMGRLESSGGRRIP